MSGSSVEGQGRGPTRPPDPSMSGLSLVASEALSGSAPGKYVRFIGSTLFVRSGNEVNREVWRDFEAD